MKTNNFMNGFPWGFWNATKPQTFIAYNDVSGLGTVQHNVGYKYVGAGNARK